jgi:hypothetical protein
MRMVQHKVNCGFPCTITSEKHLKYTRSNTNIVHANENMILDLVYNPYHLLWLHSIDKIS